MPVTDPEFKAARQRKIAEIRRTGKTWQWPDVIKHPEWTRDHKVTAGWILLTLAALGLLIWQLAS